MRRFGSFRLDRANQRLWHGEAKVSLTPKAFGVLRYLVEHAGRLVTQDELLEALWPATYVTPGVLRKYILEIRRALGDRPGAPMFIETLPKRGYQFVAPVIDESAAGTLSATAGTLCATAATRIVGRDPALAELGGYLSRARNNERQVVFITGEAGIGKTALADEFERRARADAPGIRIAHGQCVEGYGGMEAYYPVLEALGQFSRGSEGESVVQILAKQAPTWLVQFPALVSSKQREALEREILGATRERMLREIGDALETITSEKPLLLVLEDLHWADASTIDFISAMARRRARARLMLIGTYRPAEVKSAEHSLEAVKQDLLVHQLCHEIALQPLEEAEVAEYLASEAGAGAIPEGLAELVYRRTEGNPLYMVAVLEHMQDRGLIAVENGSWQIKTPLEKIDPQAPEDLRRMIELQIEGLSEGEQRVLEAATLEGIGRTRFSVASRAALIDMEPQAFEDVCETLCRRHRILRRAGSVEFPEFPDGTISACYEFVHTLYREVCYRRIAPGRRAQLHLRMGRWAEAHWERLDEAAVVMAVHFEEGGDWARAIKYLQLTAETAGRRFEPQQAADILQHALKLVKKLPEAERAEYELTILEELAKIYIAWVRKATGG
ncbi:MAG TPA: AAA family ATPase [Candidatus Acidoferrum sp.]|jgi:predicted ATPase/DNA-binding winged helix-turn-helix (wHTH) protein|nr:AAA family ATPase [Candidatus Acidoferrum sp.]